MLTVRNRGVMLNAAVIVKDLSSVGVHVAAVFVCHLIGEWGVFDEKGCVGVVCDPKGVKESRRSEIVPLSSTDAACDRSSRRVLVHSVVSTFSMISVAELEVPILKKMK